MFPTPENNLGILKFLKQDKIQLSRLLEAFNTHPDGREGRNQGLCAFLYISLVIFLKFS